MNKLYRLLVSVLCAVIATSVLSTAIYAASGGGISVSTDNVKPGDTFRIIITVPKTENADTAAIRAEFDPSAFEVTSWSPALGNSMSNSGNGFIALTSANAARTIDLSNGVELTATLTVKRTALSGKYAITLKNYSFSYVLDNGYDYKEVWSPSVTTAYITVSAPASPAVTTSTTNVNPAVTTTTVTTVTTTTSKTTTTTAKVTTPTTVMDTTDSNSDTTKTPDDEEDEEDPQSWDDGGSYYNDESSDDPLDPDDPEDDDDPEGSDEKPDITITPVLGGISSGRVKINTKSRFFDNNADIKLSNSVDAQNSAYSALKDLGLGRHKYYPFDISVFDTVRNKLIKDMGDGYIDISIPVPDKLRDAGSDLAVYHITSGIAELVYSTVFTDDGIRMIRFRATSFSPYMIVDMVGEVDGSADTNVYKLGNTSSSSGGMISGGSDNTQNYTGGTSGNAQTTGKSGPINPNTGVAAAVIIPSALVGCAFLSRKVVKKRKRTKRYIEE